MAAPLGPVPAGAAGGWKGLALKGLGSAANGIKAIAKATPGIAYQTSYVYTNSCDLAIEVLKIPYKVGRGAINAVTNTFDICHDEGILWGTAGRITGVRDLRDGVKSLLFWQKATISQKIYLGLRQSTSTKREKRDIATRVGEFIGHSCWAGSKMLSLGLAASYTEQGASFLASAKSTIGAAGRAANLLPNPHVANMVAHASSAKQAITSLGKAAFNFGQEGWMMMKDYLPTLDTVQQKTHQMIDSIIKDPSLYAGYASVVGGAYVAAKGIQNIKESSCLSESLVGVGQIVLGGAATGLGGFRVLNDQNSFSNLYRYMTPTIDSMVSMATSTIATGLDMGTSILVDTINHPWNAAAKAAVFTGLYQTGKGLWEVKEANDHWEKAAGIARIAVGLGVAATGAFQLYTGDPQE